MVGLPEETPLTMPILLNLRNSFERDVQPFVEKMEQAALDVLLNKAVWADASRILRNAYSPKIAKLSPTRDLRLTQGTTGSICDRFST
jgi:hypothetical protein